MKPRRLKRKIRLPNSPRKVKAFSQKRISDYLNDKLINVIETIKTEKDDYILNVNENDYINYKISEAHVERLELHHDKLSVSDSKQFIPAEAFPFNYNVLAGKKYEVNVFRFHIPYSGDPVLFECKPNIYITRNLVIFLTNEEVYFEIANFSNDSEIMKREHGELLGILLDQAANLNKDVKDYNATLDAEIRMAFEARKHNIQANNEIIASLGIPIRKADNVPSTFVVPSPEVKKKISIQKPEVNGSNPEPTLNESVYGDILKLIHDVGKQFERLPSLYADKEEEHLRDHFLMMLEPNFEGSATGETFNNNGKTDILLRYEGSNVFIAECKFWNGKKSFLDTITQLLGYLTWRDSKAAVIMFVRTKSISSVLNKAKGAIGEHPNYVDFKNSTDESWHNYTFHLNDDPNRHLKLAVMLYHIPK